MPISLLIISYCLHDLTLEDAGRLRRCPAYSYLFKLYRIKDLPNCSRILMEFKSLPF